MQMFEIKAQFINGVLQFVDPRSGQILASMDSQQGVRVDGAALNSAGGGPHTHPQSDITGLTAALTSKAASTHGHAIADVSGLQTALDAAGGGPHTHPISDVDGLQTALDGKTATGHGHVIGDVTGLQAGLDGKAAASHTHAQDEVTGLTAALAGKASTAHGHAIGEVTNLQSSLDAKAASSHAHAIADVTNLQTTLNGKAASSHTHAQSDITNLVSDLAGKQDASAKGQANGYASLGSDGKVPGAQLPAAQGGGITLDQVYPIGAVFLSVVSTNPATLLGFGTWAALAAGRALVTFDAGDADFDAAEKLSGAKTVTLTEAQLPAHTHSVTDPGHTHLTQRYPTATGGSSGFTIDTSMSGTLADNTQPVKSSTTGITLGNTGSGAAHANVQPSIAVHAWKRTA